MPGQDHGKPCPLFREDHPSRSSSPGLVWAGHRSNWRAGAPDFIRRGMRSSKRMLCARVCFLEDSVSAPQKSSLLPNKSTLTYKRCLVLPPLHPAWSESAGHPRQPHGPRAQTNEGTRRRKPPGAFEKLRVLAATRCWRPLHSAPGPSSSAPRPRPAVPRPLCLSPERPH